jgi:serine/threonine protein kinase
MATSVKEEKRIRIGDYVLTGKIGQGGIAEVYKGRQESLSRDVAIKILAANLTTDADIVRRFERESLVIGRLSHPNIVHVIDRGKAGNRYYFVMEYVDGTSLREVIDSQKIPLPVKLEMVVQVCKALDYAHKNGVIHRDVKPSNILIDRQGNARVADFGIAQLVGAPESEMTSAEVILGTAAYMSPEQKISSTNVDQTTDIYAVGVIIYEILTGKKPQGRFKLPSEINSEQPKAFDIIIQKCLAQEPKDRYQAAVELKDALLEITSATRAAQPTDDMSISGTESFIGHCRYLDTIKETKFGSTILVENKVNKNLYIIKKHSKGDTGRKEAKLLASLKHKNINTIYGSGGDAKSTVIISEYAPGGSLADRMVRKYEWSKAMTVMAEVANGLDFAHKNNIVHGNVRPSNILFDSSDAVKLSDFGMPSHYDATGKKNWYAPPEFKPSRVGDIYAMGVILHQLLTGRAPEYDPTDKLKLEDIRLQQPEEIEKILRKMLAIRVPERYKTCSEMILDWEEFSRRYRESEAEGSRTHQPASPSKPSLPVWVYVAIGAGVVAVLFIILLLAGVFAK